MRILVLAAFSLVAALALYQLFTYHRTVEDQEEREFGPANVLTLTQSVMHQVEGDTLRIQIWSDRTVYSEAGQRARLFNVRFTAYPAADQGIPREPIHGVARQADVLGSRSTIELAGKVRIRQGDQLEMRGEKLSYNYEVGLVSSELPIWLRNGQSVQQGESGQYSIPDELLHLSHPLVWE